MKTSHALALAATLAVSAALGPGALAASSKHSARSAGLTVAPVSFRGEGDDGGALPGGRSAHGTIGSAAPTANAAARIRALGGGDGSEGDDGGALPGGRSAHGTIGKAAPSANAAARLRALGGSND
jgi:hypothetical protein